MLEIDSYDFFTAIKKRGHFLLPNSQCSPINQNLKGSGTWEISQRKHTEQCLVSFLKVNPIVSFIADFSCCPYKRPMAHCVWIKINLKSPQSVRAQICLIDLIERTETHTLCVTVHWQTCVSLASTYISANFT